MSKKIEAIKKGKAAFLNGEPRALYGNKECLESLEKAWQMNPKERRKIIKYWENWVLGWDIANIAAPVDGIN